MASAIEPPQEATPEWRPQRSGRTTSRRRAVVVATSPALSLDGTKVAFVETGSGARLIFTSWPGRVGMELKQIFNRRLPRKPSTAALPRWLLLLAPELQRTWLSGQPATRCLRPSLTMPTMWLTSVTTPARCSASFMSFAQIRTARWGISGAEPRWHLGIGWRARYCVFGATDRPRCGWWDREYFCRMLGRQALWIYPGRSLNRGFPVDRWNWFRDGGNCRSTDGGRGQRIRLCRERKFRRRNPSSGPSQHDKL